MSKQFTLAEVAEHRDAEKGMYIIVDANVYNITGTYLPSHFHSPSASPHNPHSLDHPTIHPIHPSSHDRIPFDLCTAPPSMHLQLMTIPYPEFINEHPGGSKILKRVAGKDASKQFWKYHNEGVLKKYAPKLKIGDVKESAKL